MSANRSFYIGLGLGALAVSLGYSIVSYRNKSSVNGVEDLIGNTPLMKIKSLSDYTGCNILAKLEMNNPAGSAKDRVALAIIKDAERDHLISPHHGDVIFEGTSGSTGISFAMLANALGYTAHICLPDDTSPEKVNLLTALGAIVEKVRPASIVDKKQYVNAAKLAAEKLTNNKSTNSKGLFANQFENESNWKCHFKTTGPEIYKQTNGKVDFFITSAGTGGTISGISTYLKSKLKNVKVILADPQGSGFYNKIKYGVMFDAVEKEGHRRRHQVDTIIEGVGLNRITKNFDIGSTLIDDAIRVKDDQALKMAKWLVKNDGLFVGSSAAINCAAILKLAQTVPKGSTIVTIICDSGNRHLSKFWKEAVKVDDTVTLQEIEELFTTI